MKAITVLAIGCVAVASAASAVEESRVVDVQALAALETDEELTAQFNAALAADQVPQEIEAEGAEEHEVERRGGYHRHHLPKPRPPPPPPAPHCCYWEGNWFKPGYWYDRCYCGPDGKWTCKKPQPPAPKCCAWNGKYYPTGAFVYLVCDYACHCVDGKWSDCYYCRK